MVLLIVISFFTAFFMLDLAIQYSVSSARKRAAQAGLAPAGASIPPLSLEAIPVPAGCFLGSGHTWARIEASGSVRVGLDDFAVRSLGRIDAVDLPEAGARVACGEKLFAVRQGSRKAEFAAPVDGVVRLLQADLARDPSAIRSDPYQKGWICVLSPTNLSRSLRGLRIAEEAGEWLRQEIARLRDLLTARPLCAAAAGEVLPDGGQIATGFLEHADDETWKLYQDRFLRGSSPGT